MQIELEKRYIRSGLPIQEIIRIRRKVQRQRTMECQLFSLLQLVISLAMTQRLLKVRVQGAFCLIFLRFQVV